VLLVLLKGLAKPEPTFFQKDLEKLSFLAGDGSSSFLEFPGVFVLKTVLGSPSPVARFSGSDFSQWLTIILSAQTRDDLVDGRVEMYKSRMLSFGLDLDGIQRRGAK
jgi:hypothetical protein